VPIPGMETVYCLLENYRKRKVKNSWVSCLNVSTFSFHNINEHFILFSVNFQKNINKWKDESRV
jgi:hypothetical protein